MTNETTISAAEQTAAGEPAATEPSATGLPRPRRLWPGCVLIGIYWATVAGFSLTDLPISTSFMTTAGVGALVILLFTIWWLTNRSVAGRDRLAIFAALVLGGVAAAAVSQKTLGTGGVLFYGLPWSFTAWIVWCVLARRSSQGVFRWGAIAAIWLVWGYVSLLRVNGISGDLKADVDWRWEPTTEEIYLAQRRQDTSTPSADDEIPESVMPAEGDWTAFRGPLHNGEVRGLEIATDWNKTPPELVWRERIGPAWSSMLIVDGRLFTQEQMGEEEAVDCFDATSGKRLWTHTDKVRFWDGQGGAGPRATPTFHAGVIYTQGATGILSCLDAATGKKKWSRNIADDASAALPPWGFSSTPLVVDDLVITFAGGKDGHGLLAYRASDGSPAWHVATGPVSYSSPWLVEIDGRQQVFFLSDLGVIAVDPESGAVAWQYEANGHGVWRASEPVRVAGDRVLFGSEDLGTVCLEVRQDADRWSAAPQWTSRALKPAYDDFVVDGDAIYGFDGGIFSAIDVATGKRRWRGGRYGHGQVLLLADQNLLLITAESGELVLLRATPEKHEELAKFQAVEGKTWNHPAVAQGCVYVRNDQEIACYRLPRL